MVGGRSATGNDNHKITYAALAGDSFNPGFAFFYAHHLKTTNPQGRALYCSNAPDGDDDGVWLTDVAKYFGPGPNPRNQWSLLEYLIHWDPTAGLIRSIEDGVTFVNYGAGSDKSVDRNPGTARKLTIGHFGRPYSEGGNNWRFWSDIYLDTSWARIVIGEGDTLESSKVRASQVPTAWSPRSITFQCRQGAHSELAGKSLFVVRPDGTSVKVATLA